MCQIKDNYRPITFPILDYIQGIYKYTRYNIVTPTQPNAEGKRACIPAVLRNNTPSTLIILKTTFIDWKCQTIFQLTLYGHLHVTTEQKPKAESPATAVVWVE